MELGWRDSIPTKVAAGDLVMLSGMHFVYYPSMEAKAAFDQEPDFLKRKQELNMSAMLDKMFGFVTKEDDFEFFRERDAIKN